MVTYYFQELLLSLVSYWPKQKDLQKLLPHTDLMNLLTEQRNQPTVLQNLPTTPLKFPTRHLKATNHPTKP